VTEDQSGYVLAHPVYLDVAMMISFLAYLEGGVITQEEETQKEGGARERVLKGRAGVSTRKSCGRAAGVRGLGGCGTLACGA
jgi:hypothetical protein